MLRAADASLEVQDVDLVVQDVDLGVQDGALRARSGSVDVESNSLRCRVCIFSSSKASSGGAEMARTRAPPYRVRKRGDVRSVARMPNRGLACANAEDG